MAINIGSFDFGKVIEFMQASGFYSYLLPLLLIFALIFAVLEKTKVLGKKSTNINMVVALISGFLLVAQTELVQTINNFLPNVSMILLVILMFLMLIGLISNKKPGLKGELLSVAFIVVLIAVIIALINSVPGTNSFISSEDAESLLQIGIPIGLLLLAIIFLTRSGRGSGRPEANRQRRNLLRWLGEGIGSDEED